MVAAIGERLRSPVDADGQLDDAARSLAIEPHLGVVRVLSDERGREPRRCVVRREDAARGARHEWGGPGGQQRMNPNAATQTSDRPIRVAGEERVMLASVAVIETSYLNLPRSSPVAREGATTAGASQTFAARGGRRACAAQESA